VRIFITSINFIKFLPTELSDVVWDVSKSHLEDKILLFREIDLNLPLSNQIKHKLQLQVLQTAQDLVVDLGKPPVQEELGTTASPRAALILGTLLLHFKEALFADIVTSSVSLALQLYVNVANNSECQSIDDLLIYHTDVLVARLPPSSLVSLLSCYIRSRDSSETVGSSWQAFLVSLGASLVDPAQRTEILSGLVSLSRELALPSSTKDDNGNLHMYINDLLDSVFSGGENNALKSHDILIGLFEKRGRFAF